MPDMEKVIYGLYTAIGALRALKNKFPNTEEDIELGIQACTEAVALLKEHESWINEIAEYKQSVIGSGMHELDDYEKGKLDGLQIAWNIISEGR